jgi:lauroyl/myristoyl acyltransferase
VKTLRKLRDADAVARRFGLRAIPPYRPLCLALEASWSIPAVRRRISQGVQEKLPAHPFFAGDAPPDARALKRLFACRVASSWKLNALDVCRASTVHKCVSLSGREHFEKAATGGHGVILVHAHYGAAHSVSVALNRLGLPHAAVLKFRQQARDPLIRHLDLIPITRDPVRPLLLARERLKHRGNVLITGDGPHGERVRVPFLGTEAGFPQGFAILSLITRAPMLPVFSVPGTGGRFTIELLPALDPGEPDGPWSKRVEAIVRQYAGLLEQRWLEDPALVWWMGKDLQPPLPWRPSAPGDTRS